MLERYPSTQALTTRLRLHRLGHEVVLKTALARMHRCECGPETSCYGCLRDFRNQPYHDQLRRGDALAFLARLV